jgi:hypothetical protein
MVSTLLIHHIFATLNAILKETTDNSLKRKRNFLFDISSLFCINLALFSKERIVE